MKKKHIDIKKRNNFYFNFNFFLLNEGKETLDN